MVVHIVKLIYCMCCNINILLILQDLVTLIELYVHNPKLYARKLNSIYNSIVYITQIESKLLWIALNL